VAVGDHRTVVVEGERDGHRRVPVVISLGVAEVDRLVLGEDLPAEVAVPVLAEGGGE